ncbi:hypothetical protein OV760_29860, partial [Salmonella enterica subsp. enterica serovar 1,4,[5],12:i:-]|nr:hypothetical protein [Salmonella enterica subsp. enterica serovar 1,4,[5],12:i:-]
WRCHSFGGFDQLISVRASADEESGWGGGGVAADDGDGGWAEGLALNPLELIENKGGFEKRSRSQ